jgi:H+-translocating NAD(P) transhydrogenase subunit alpha
MQALVFKEPDRKVLSMIVGVPKETFEGEKRVALSPDAVATLIKTGLEVHIESNAGLEAGFTDEAYARRGAKIISDRSEIFARSKIIAQVQTPSANTSHGGADIEAMTRDHIVLGCADPLSGHEGLEKMLAKGISLFAMEMIPRITRAQSMDVLSSQANLAGYKAVLMAANELAQACPMFMTAAGTIKPARIFIVGAGVAGLQAIATARRLGAIVTAYDVRAACKEQVESLGAKFVEVELDTSDQEDKGGYAKEQSANQLKKQQEQMARVVADSDVIITTAAIPGRKAPVIVTADMVKKMRPGSVIIDLAAERGGNCELTEARKTVIRHNVKIVGPSNIPATIARDASLMYGNNVATFLKLITKDGELNLDMDDEIISGTLVCKDGQVLNERIRGVLGIDEKPSKPEDKPESSSSEESTIKEGSAA